MAENKFVNPSFETEVTPWAGRANVTSIDRVADATAFDGSYVGRISTAAAAVDTEIQNEAGRVPLGSSILYVYSVRVRPKAADRVARVYVEYVGTNGLSNGVANGTAVTCPVNVWTTIHVTATSPIDNASARAVVRVKDVTSAGELIDVDGFAFYEGTSDPAWQSTAVVVTANAGPDQIVPADSAVTLVGTPPGGVWTQDSGTAVTLSAPITNATDTRVTFVATNSSTTTNNARVFRYTVDPKITGTDNFNRAASTTSVGSFPNGPAYVAYSGTWGIDSSGRAYCVTTADNQFLTLDVATSDWDMSAVVTAGSAAYPGLVAAFTDWNNCYILELSPEGGMVLNKRIGGAVTGITSMATGTAPSGSTVRWRRNAGVITVWVGGTQVYQSTNVHTQLTSTKIGFRYGNVSPGASATWDDLTLA